MRVEGASWRHELLLRTAGLQLLRTVFLGILHRNGCGVVVLLGLIRDGRVPSTCLSVCFPVAWPRIHHALNNRAIGNPDLHLLLLLLKRGCLSNREVADGCRCRWSLIETIVIALSLARQDGLVVNGLSLIMRPSCVGL